MKVNKYSIDHTRREEARARLSRQSDATRREAINRYEMIEHAKSEARATIAAAVSWTLILAFGAYAAYLYIAL